MEGLGVSDRTARFACDCMMLSGLKRRTHDLCRELSTATFRGATLGCGTLPERCEVKPDAAHDARDGQAEQAPRCLGRSFSSPAAAGRTARYGLTSVVPRAEPTLALHFIPSPHSIASRPNRLREPALGSDDSRSAMLHLPKRLQAELKEALPSLG